MRLLRSDWQRLLQVICCLQKICSMQNDLQPETIISYVLYCRLHCQANSFFGDWISAGSSALLRSTSGCDTGSYHCCFGAVYPLLLIPYSACPPWKGAISPGIPTSASELRLTGNLIEPANQMQNMPCVQGSTRSLWATCSPQGPFWRPLKASPLQPPTASSHCSGFFISLLYHFSFPFREGKADMVQQGDRKACHSCLQPTEHTEWFSGWEPGATGSYIITSLSVTSISLVGGWWMMPWLCDPPQLIEIELPWFS